MRNNQKAMPISGAEKVNVPERGALLCVADAGLAERLTREIKLCAEVKSVSTATGLPDLLERMEQDLPRVILLDGDLFRMLRFRNFCGS